MVTAENYGYHKALQVVTVSEIEFHTRLLKEIDNDMQIDGVKAQLRHRILNLSHFLQDLKNEEKAVPSKRNDDEDGGEGE